VVERQLKLGTFLAGIHAGHWRDPDEPSNLVANIDEFISFAQIAEAAKFDFGFIADSVHITEESAWALLSRLEPITALSALSAVTTHIGLSATLSTSYSNPFDVARQFASLDLISGGRAGWNVVTSALEGAGRNYGADRLHSHELRYRIAEEHVEVVRGLWNSWSDDAFVRNKQTGQYIDKNKLFPLNHRGEFFNVEGPLNVERSAQGHPVIFQAGASPAGKRLAAATADAIYAPPPEDEERARASYREWKRLASEAGRDPDNLLVFPNFQPVVGRTRIEAQEHYDTTNRFIDVDHSLRIISRYFNFYDFGPIADQPFPDGIVEAAKDGFRSAAEYLVTTANARGETVAEAAVRASRPPKDFVGTAVEIADKIERNFRAGTFDGLVVTVSKDNLQRFIELVVPILQERGLFRTEYESTTLRGNLGLPFPSNPNVSTNESSVPESSLDAVGQA
jgi:FMN-dependent oxidoreductase (nitrilotriacetate monooxygenase family)